MARELAMPDEIIKVAGLEAPDYAEAFAFETRVNRTPEQWARVILEGAPMAERLKMLGAWTLLGVRLAPPWAAGHVLGWRIRENGPGTIVLGCRAAIGLTARIVVGTLALSEGEIDDGGWRVMHAMVVRYESALGRRVWTFVAPRHRGFLEGLLDRL